MADLSNIPTEQLQQMLQASQTTQQVPAQASSDTAQPNIPAQSVDLSKIPTDQLHQMLESTKAPDSQGALGTAYAAAQGLSTGVVEGISAMGSLANNILKGGAHLLYGKDSNVEKGLDVAGDIGQAGMNKLKGLIAPSPGFAQKAIQENPNAYGIGGAIGNIGTQTALMNKILTPAAAVANKVISKVAPGISASPLASNALSQGSLGAGVGAAANPNDPLKGALQGAAIGAVAGGLTGVAGESARTAGAVVNKTIEELSASGQPINNLKAVRTIQEHLKTEGLPFRKYEVEQEVKAAISDHLDKIRPNAFEPGNSPLPLIANKTIQNAENVKLQNAQNYAPINDATDTFTPKNYTDMLENVKGTLPKIGLPNNQLSENATLNQMLEQRRLLDGTIKQAQLQAASGKIPQSKVAPYYQVRQALNQDIHESAANIGLEDTLNKAEQFNQANVQPFKLIDKQGNIQDNPKAEAKVWTTISSQLQARRPNYTTIMQNSARLGPDGKELLGWGMVENAFNKAGGNLAEGADFKPPILRSQLVRMKASGVLDTLGTDTHKDVVNGIIKVIDASTKAAAAAPSEIGMIGSKIQLLTHSRAGIGLLKRIGNPSASAQTIRDLTQQLFTGMLANQAAQPGE